MPNNTVRKNFQLKADLEPRLIHYCEKSGLTQAQALNLAVRNFLDLDSMKSWIVKHNLEVCDDRKEEVNSSEN